MGTKCKATIMRIVDGDTALVKINGKVETVRAIYCDTEESKPELKSKPVTNCGIMAMEFGKQYWWNKQPILEFDRSDSLEKCLEEERDYFGRLRCYFWHEGENYNLRLIREGLSPYFTKYGYSQLYHDEFMQTQEEAQFLNAGIWNPQSNGETPGPNYVRLIPRWNARAEIMHQYKVNGRRNILDATSSCDNLCHQISQIQRSRFLKFSNEVISLFDIVSSVFTIHYSPLLSFYSPLTTHYSPLINKPLSLKLFVDLQGGIHSKFFNGFLCRSGSKKSFLNLWFPSRQFEEVIKKNYSDYCFISGNPSVRRGVVQITVEAVSDRPDFSIATTIPKNPSAVERERHLKDVRYAARSAIERINANSHQ